MHNDIMVVFRVIGDEDRLLEYSGLQLGGHLPAAGDVLYLNQEHEAPGFCGTWRVDSRTWWASTEGKAPWVEILLTP